MHERIIFRGLAKKILKERMLLSINPVAVTHYVDVPFYQQRKRIKNRLGKKFGNFINNQVLVFRSGFCPGGDWDLDMIPVEHRLAYIHMQDLWRNKDRYQESLWYKTSLDKFKQTGQFKHKNNTITSQAELDTLFSDYLLDMLSSMSESGYLDHLNSENPRVLITRNGELVKTRRGRHRFAAARIVGISRMSVEIDNIHPYWISKVGGGFYGTKLKRLCDAIGLLETQTWN